MKFKDVELLPGVVIDIEDPKKIGRIKVTVPGLFDSTAMDKEGLPWVYPLTMHGYQGFYKLLEGSKVWVFKTENNYKEFWYIPMFDLNDNTKELISDYTESDVLISRSAGENSIYLYYEEETGLMGKIGENGEINITKDGEIVIRSGEGYVELKGGKVYVGGKDPKEPAVLGKQLTTVLTQLAADLKALGNAATGPYTSPLSMPFMTASENLKNGTQKITADSTFVS